MKKITNWNIKRAGAGMTIAGVDFDTGQPTKVSLIKLIEAAGTGAAKGMSVSVATDAAGQQFALG